MSQSVTDIIHSLALKKFLENIGTAAQQLTDEAATTGEAAVPAYAPLISLAAGLADTEFGTILARVKKLELDQEAKAANPAPAA